MFTGLIESVGRVTAFRRVGTEADLEVDLRLVDEPEAASGIGASIAISGVCCTVVRRIGGAALFRLSEETLRKTWLGQVRPGTEVNVERAMRAGQPFGGHIVQGHVDGVAEVTTPVDARRGGELGVRLPEDLARYVVEKGSIALDGISLTAWGLDGRDLKVAVIPHTVTATTIHGWRRGSPVHVEVDVIAKYVEKLVAPHRPA
jgi:riboflavin synthase